MAQSNLLESLQDKIASCRLCPRLVEWREQVAREKRAAFKDQTYWGRPVPSFGDPAAKILLCGLAPAAHGGNRTGRIFTGDRSGDWLFASLHRCGLANQAQSISKDDGLSLKGVYVTACVRCAPPQNKPTPEEKDRCNPYLVHELQLLKNLRVIVCLGGFAWQGVLQALSHLGHKAKPFPKFGHSAQAQLGPYTLLGSYHPSQQNTFTGKLTQKMQDELVEKAKKLGGL